VRPDRTTSIDFVDAEAFGPYLRFITIAGRTTMSAYEFACEHLFPGCTTKIEGDTEEEVSRKATEHLRTHHAVDPVRQPDVNTEMWKAIARLYG
jgi:predicted small metal-binding protein